MVICYAERHLIDAGLIVIRCPVEQAGIGIEKGTGRQEIAEENHRAAIRITALQIETQAISFLNGSVRRSEQGQRLVGGGNDEHKAGLGLINPITGNKGHLLIGTGRFIIRCPGEHVSGVIKPRTRWQIVGPVG